MNKILIILMFLSGTNIIKSETTGECEDSKCCNVGCTWEDSCASDSVVCDNKKCEHIDWEKGKFCCCKKLCK